MPALVAKQLGKQDRLCPLSDELTDVKRLRYGNAGVDALERYGDAGVTREYILRFSFAVDDRSD